MIERDRDHLESPISKQKEQFDKTDRKFIGDNFKFTPKESINSVISRSILNKASGLQKLLQTF